MLYDPDVSDKGVLQLEELRSQCVRDKLSEQVELAVYSPLTRAIRTMVAAFADDDVPKLVSADCIEIMDTTGDVGTAPQELAKEFPDLDFSSLEDAWWYYDEKRGPRVAVDEPISRLNKRIVSFTELLNSRPEKCIAVVSHSQFIKRITHTRSKLPNCGIMKCSLTQDGVMTPIT